MLPAAISVFLEISDALSRVRNYLGYAWFTGSTICSDSVLTLSENCKVEV